MNVMIREYVATLIRNLLLPLISYLSATGYFTEADLVQLVGTIVPIVFSIVWGLANKYLWKEAAKDALQSSPSSSPAKLEDVIAGK